MRGLVLALGVVACAARAPSASARTQEGVVRMTLEVDARRVACTGEGRRQCLRVRTLPDTGWRRFYDPIEGFTYEEGYRWRLEVERRRVPNPPADGSSLTYRLVRVIAKEQVP